MLSDVHHHTVARRADFDDIDDDDYDYDDDNYFTPASSVPRLCAQLPTNDPSVFVEGPNELFEPDVLDSCRLEIAEALAQNHIVRRMGFILPK